MPAVYRATDLLRRGIPFTAMHLYRLEAAGKFPKRFKIIEGGQSVAWVAAEVDAWMAARSLPAKPSRPDQQKNGADLVKGGAAARKHLMKKLKFTPELPEIQSN